MATIRTSKGHVFSLDHNPVMRRYTAVGPLYGGNLILRLESTVRVSSEKPERQEARQDLLDQLTLRGY